MLRQSSLVVAAVLALLLASCADGGLERRAADFYSYMAGQRPGDSLENYLSPASRQEIRQDTGTAQGLGMYEALFNALRPSAQRVKPIQLEDIRTATEGNFALSWLEGRPDLPMADSPPLRWVRVSGRWYLYLGSEGEVKAYKDFPSALRAEKGGLPRATATQNTTKGKVKGGTG